MSRYFNESLKGEFLYINNKVDEIHSSFPESMAFEKSPALDVIGVIEMLEKSYLLGNRTLIKDIKRIPWYSKRKKEDGWEFYNLPNHNDNVLESGEIASELKRLLKLEMLTYVSGKKNVGILLSGGLDSRIVAGIIKEIQEERVESFNVVAFTWGHPESRDYNYAKEICNRFEWGFKHVEVSVEDLKENFYLAAEHGAEFSPLHLHGLSKVNSSNEVECVIAGSYGDSVGRAEFSGRRVDSVKPILAKNLNKYNILNIEIISDNVKYVKSDAFSYKKVFYRNQEYQYREIEQQLHYMRRKLDACMNVNRNLKIRQAFTDPSVFGYMWSLHPKIRNDEVYEYILESLPNEIGTIPWARTGRPLTKNNDFFKEDNLTNIQYNYAVWLRNDLKEFILDKLNNFDFSKGNIFNPKAIKKLQKIWLKGDTASVSQIDEIITWLVTFVIFVEKYNIQIEEEKNISKLYNSISSILGGVKGEIYQIARNKLRK